MKSAAEKMVIINGIITLLFVVFHTMFWWLFNWKVELTKLSPVNYGIMLELNIAMICLLLVFTFCCFFLRTELLMTKLGRAVLIGWALTMYVRAIDGLIIEGFSLASIMPNFIVAAYATLSLIPGIKSNTAN